MEELWPEPSPRAADVIRQVCQKLLTEADQLTDSATALALTAQNTPALLSDASLAQDDRDVSHADLMQWLTSNIQRPGRRVQPYFGARTASYIQDLASRGLAPDFTEGFRTGIAVLWRRWLHDCIDLCTDKEVLEDVLATIAQSMAQYPLDWFAALREASAGDALGNAGAGAVAMIQLIASGENLPLDFAEGGLNYRLSRWHQAMVLWVEDERNTEAMDSLLAAVRSQVGRNALVARGTSLSRWVWISGPNAPDLSYVEKLAAQSGKLRVTVGRPGQGLEGFRSSHLDALAAQAMIIRLGSRRGFTEYADVELIDALTKDRAMAGRFVTKTLGPLAEADESLRESLLTYVQCGFNTTRAAASLYAHRNTVERRVTRANELSVVKVEDNPAHVAAALLVLELAPDIAERPSA